MDDLFGMKRNSLFLQSFNPAPAPPGGRRLLHQQNDPVHRSGTVPQPRAGHLAADRAPPAVDAVEEHLVAVGAAVQAVADRPRQTLDRQADVERQERLPLHLVAAQPPELVGLVAPDLHRQLGVEHHHGRAQAAEDRVEMGVDVAQLVRSLLELVVHRPQLLVGGLELLVHRLQLLVGRLQLLVGGLQLLDGGLELLVGGLQLLVGRLQLLGGGLQLLGGPFELPAELVLDRHVGKGDADPEQRAAALDQRHAPGCPARAARRRPGATRPP